MVKDWLLVEAVYDRDFSPLHVKIFVILINYAQAASVIFVASLLFALAWRIVN